jgi:regulatory protein
MKKSPLQYALDLIKLRDRTEFEIKSKMRQKGFDDEEIIKTINWLKEKIFLDDERFTKHYVKNAHLSGRSGKYKITFKLRTLGIDKELIDKYVTTDSDYDNALDLGQRWVIKNVNKDKKYEKLGRFLLGRGFEIDVVKRVLDEVLDK